MEDLKLGSYIYVVFGIGITREFIAMKGESVFAHWGCFDPNNLEEYRKPLQYSDYGKKWFKSLKEVENKYGKLEKLDNNYWEVK